jgi:uncharacterized membrane protein YedE/YeeE
MNELLSSWVLLISGVLIGLIAGFTTHRARLCSFGAIEDAVLGGDTRRIRVFALALGIAIISTQFLIHLGDLVPENTTYVPSAIPWIGILTGSLIFGLGMALVGTCSYGSLVRLGSGDLRSFVVVIIFALVAYAVLRGGLAPVRISIFEAAPLRHESLSRTDLPGLFAFAFGNVPRLALGLAIGFGLIVVAFTHRKLRSSPRLLIAGITLGLCAFCGWAATTYLADPFDSNLKPQSLTFVAPVARTLFAVLQTPANLIDFGVGSVFGVVLGSLLSTLVLREFRWEAFDDQREMRRHLLGAAMMGFGGILAGGCTIGQGLTAGSMLALSWPIAVAGMVIGARIGIAILVEGSLRDLLRRFAPR